MTGQRTDQLTPIDRVNLSRLLQRYPRPALAPNFNRDDMLWAEAQHMVVQFLCQASNAGDLLR